MCISSLPFPNCKAWSSIIIQDRRTSCLNTSYMYFILRFENKKEAPPEQQQEEEEEKQFFFLGGGPHRYSLKTKKTT